MKFVAFAGLLGTLPVSAHIVEAQDVHSAHQVISDYLRVVAVQSDVDARIGQPIYGFDGEYRPWEEACVIERIVRLTDELWPSARVLTREGVSAMSKTTLRA